MALLKTIAGLRTLGGTVGRAEYAALGCILFLLKCLLDHALAPFVLGRPWSFLNYLNVGQAQLVADASRTRSPVYSAMFLVALPFLWAGVVLTLKRLRDARMPLWLVFMFFAPVINLLFFVALCLIGSRYVQVSGRQSEATTETDAAQGAAHRPAAASMGMAIGLTAALGWVLVGFNVYALGVYGAGLFVGLPFCLGIIAAVIYGYYGARSCGGCVGVGFLSVITLAAVLFSTGFEGFGCLIMAAPIWLVCALLGGSVGYFIQRYARDEREIAILVISRILALLVGLHYSYNSPARAQPRSEFE